jgi:hypothetical protein
LGVVGDRRGEFVVVEVDRGLEDSASGVEVVDQFRVDVLVAEDVRRVGADPFGDSFELRRLRKRPPVLARWLMRPACLLP